MALNLLDFQAQFQNPMAQGIVKKWMQESVFSRILNFVGVDGFAYQYGEDAGAPGVAYRGLNESYPDQAAGVVNPKVETMPIFGGVVKTDAQIYNKQGNKARANEIARRQRATALFFDKEVIHGDGATDPKAMTGLYARLTGDQLITAGQDGAALTLDMVDNLIDSVYGTNDQKVLICNKFCRRKIKKLLLSAAGGAGIADFGGSLASYDGVKIEVLDEDETEVPLLTFNEVCGNSAVTTSILCVHPGSTTDQEGMQGLTGSGGIKLIEQGWQGPLWCDLVEAHMGIALFHGRSAARLKGILKS